MLDASRYIGGVYVVQVYGFRLVETEVGKSQKERAYFLVNNVMCADDQLSHLTW